MMNSFERQIKLFTTFFVLSFNLYSTSIFVESANISVEWNKYFENELPIGAISGTDSSCILLTSNTLRVFSQNGILKWSKNIFANGIYAVHDTLFLSNTIDSCVVGINYLNGDSIFSRKIVPLNRDTPRYFATLDSFSCKMGRLNQSRDTLWTKTSDISGYKDQIDTSIYKNIYFSPSPDIYQISLENGHFVIVKKVCFRPLQQPNSYNFERSCIEIYDSNGVYQNKVVITEKRQDSYHDFYQVLYKDSVNTFTVTIGHYKYDAGTTFSKIRYNGELNSWGNSPSWPINSIEIDASNMRDIFVINSVVTSKTDRLFVTGKYNSYRQMLPWQFLLLETDQYGKVLKSYNFGYDSTFTSSTIPVFSESPFILKSTDSSCICWGKLKNGTKIIKLNMSTIPTNIKTASRIANKNQQKGIVVYDILGRNLYSNRINSASSNILNNKASNMILMVRNNSVSSFTHIKNNTFNSR